MLEYLQVTPYYKTYGSMKTVMFSATFLLVLMLLGIFVYLPEWNRRLQKILTSVIVIVSMFSFTGLILLIAWCVNSRNLNQRFRTRQHHFTKVFKLLNRSHFSSKGIKFESGKYGAYILIKVDRAKIMKEMGGDMLNEESEQLESRPSRINALIYDELARSEVASSHKGLSSSEYFTDHMDRQNIGDTLANTLNVSQPLDVSISKDGSTPTKKTSTNNLMEDFLKQTQWTRPDDQEELRKKVLGAIVLTDDEDEDEDFEKPATSPSKKGMSTIKFSNADLDSSAIIKREQDKMAFSFDEKKKSMATEDTDHKNPSEFQALLLVSQIPDAELARIDGTEGMGIGQTNQPPEEFSVAADEFKSVIEHSQFNGTVQRERKPTTDDFEEAEFFSAIEGTTTRSGAPN